MKIGIFGGSFDPVHLGHLIVAESARECLELDKVLLIPAARSPHKESSPSATNRQRLEMLQLAISGHDQFEISPIELDRGEISYTVDTLTALHKTNPDDDYFLILGADSVAGFDRWRDPARILELATLIVANRGGCDRVNFEAVLRVKPEMDLEQLNAQVIDCPLIEISSSEIRTRLANQKSIRYLTPRAVEKYIETATIYSESSVADVRG